MGERYRKVGRPACAACADYDDCEECSEKCGVCGWPMNMHAIDADEVFVEGIGYVACESPAREGGNA